MRSVTSLLPLALMLWACACIVTAQPPPPPAPCSDTSSCLGLSSGASCYYVNTNNNTVSCGVCAVQNGCTLACAANSNQASCTIPTCTTLAAGTGGIGINSACGTTRVIAGDALKTPVSFTSSNGALNLNITVNYLNWNATAFTMTSRVYCVGLVGGVQTCSVPAPAIHVLPGDTLTVILNNNLGTDYTTSKVANTFRTPNYVNMHTHGFHVDPSIDNVMITIAPGASYTYVYQVPSDHLPGNHWYHSHVHGTSALQVMGGMAGMLFVDPPSTFTAPSTAYSAMTTNVIQIMHVSMCTCNPTNDPFAYRTYVNLQGNGGDNLVSNNFVQQTGYTEKDILLINGQYQPRLTIQPGEWRRLEITNSAGTVFHEIQLMTAMAGGTAPCTMMVLALDGIFVKATRTMTMVPIPPAGRVALAIMCPSAGTYYLQDYPQKRASDYEAQVQQNLITIQVAGATLTMTSPSWSAGTITYPSYLTDLTSATPTATFQIGVDQTAVTAPAGNWLGIGTNCSDASSGRGSTVLVDPNTYGNCAYQPFAMTGNYRFTAPGCSVVEATIVGRGATPHPIHMHVHAFEVVSSISDDGTTNPYTQYWGSIGDLRDTVPAFSGNTVVRFRATGWQGAIMIHCHFLAHEDMGMMDRWWTGTTTAGTCTATSTTNVCNSSVPAAAFLTTFTSTPLTCSSTTSPSTAGTATTASPSGTTVSLTTPSNVTAKSSAVARGHTRFVLISIGAVTLIFSIFTM